MLKSHHLPALRVLSLLIIFFSLSPQIVVGQSVEGKTFNSKGYQAWVTLEDSRVIRGLLWNVNPEKIIIKSDQVKGWKNPNSSAEIIEVPVDRIQSIRTKKTRAVLKGYGVGAITGNSLGAVVALIDGEDFSILFVPLFGMIGSVTGLIAGALPDKTFEIEMNQQKLRQAIPDLDKRAFWKCAEGCY